MAQMIDGKLHAIWSVEDVMSLAEDGDLSITNEQAVATLERAAKYHDANTGINWQFLEDCLYFVLNEEEA